MNSFFSAVPETPREELLEAYLSFLERRNGTVDPAAEFGHRERWLSEIDSSQARYDGVVDGEVFQRNFVRFDSSDVRGDKAVLALLAFAKMNAGEAYGVEAVTRARHGKPVSGTFDRLERVLGKEETYHTRILLGATRNFGIEPPRAAFKAPVELRVIIGALVHAPHALFHPILLGAEIGGVFGFNWMLGKVRELFKEQPRVRELMEARLIEILVDEVGHIAFNRLAVGPKGMRAARAIAPQVAHHGLGVMPEVQAIGWSRSVSDGVAGFDYASLPEEVRSRAFFV